MDTLPIVLICLVAVLFLIGIAALINLATKKERGPTIPYVPTGDWPFSCFASSVTCLLDAPKKSLTKLFRRLLCFCTVIPSTRQHIWSNFWSKTTIALVVSSLRLHIHPPTTPLLVIIHDKCLGRCIYTAILVAFIIAWHWHNMVRSSIDWGRCHRAEVPQCVCLRRIVLNSRLRLGALLREKTKCWHTLDRSLNRSVTHLCLFSHGVDLNIIDPLAVTHKRFRILPFR